MSRRVAAAGAGAASPDAARSRGRGSRRSPHARRADARAHGGATMVAHSPSMPALPKRPTSALSGYFQRSLGMERVTYGKPGDSGYGYETAKRAPLRSTKTSITSRPGRKPPAKKQEGTSKIHATKVMVVKGELLARPHYMSKKPFLHRPDASEPYGGYNAVLNTEPGGMRSEAQSHFQNRRPQSAGCTRKAPVRYTPYAQRNRLAVPFPRSTKFNESNLEFSYGVPAVGRANHPFETVAHASQAPTETGPIETRVGFTNPAISALRTHWEQRFVLE